MPRIKEYENPPINVTEVIVNGNREISPGVHLISWKRIHDFHPGQCVKITCDEAIPPRIYSICSGINESKISILFNIKEDGRNKRFPD